MSQQQATVERYNVSLGSLRSQIELKLHTYHALRVWQGGQPTGKAGYTVPNMTQYFAITNMIRMTSARDNPFADWWMIKLEEKLDQAQQEMNELSALLEKLISAVPEQVTITDNLNQKPFTTPVFCNSHLGFRAVFLLESYDGLARKILLANHVGLLSRRDMEGFLDQGAHQLRSLFGMALTYKNTGVTRDDMAANNARAREAIERLGTPPTEILNGTLRSEFAPNIQRNADAAQDDDAGELEELPQTQDATDIKLEQSQKDEQQAT